MLHQWQLDLLDKMTNRNGKELKISMGGRNIGKSHWTNMAIDRLMRDLNSHPISDLVLSEGTVYGSRYYCVEPYGGSWMDMELWCMEAFGTASGSIWGENPAPEPAMRWYMNNRKFWFRDEADQLMFVMKWR
jgi:hypothetical protein